jgi:hypothetical protein
MTFAIIFEDHICENTGFEAIQQVHVIKTKQ